MKDLKHMIYFEKLLDSACNDLVREAQKENLGRCWVHLFSYPGSAAESGPLLFLSDCGLRIWVLQRLQRIIWQAVPANFSRALLERAIEGGFQFLDAIAGVDICECMNRCYENMELLEIHGEREKEFLYQLCGCAREKMKKSRWSMW